MWIWTTLLFMPHHPITRGYPLESHECHHSPTSIWTLIKIWSLTEWQYGVSNPFLISWPMTPVNVGLFTALDLGYETRIYFCPTSYTRTWWIMEVYYGLKEEWHQYYRYHWHHTRHIPNNSMWYTGIRHSELEIFDVPLTFWLEFGKYWCSIHMLIQVTQ